MDSIDNLANKLRANRPDTGGLYYLCAFALLDNSYKDKAIAENQLKEEEQEKHKLADKALPMNITVTRKEMTVVGWSPNLLKNASGENKDMKHWNTSGDIRVCDASGYGTEACFKTSNMWSCKYQEVNLLDHFAAEYLDTAPDIQVSEWYKQGHCSGGFYCFTAQLMSDDGQVIKEYTTGELGTLTNKDWQEASVTFSGYGSGARIVTFSSKGKDDKYWTGYFGPYISAAGVRVKKESKPAKDDSFSDIDQADDSAKRSNLVDDKHLPVDQEFEKQTDMSNELHGWKGGKKQTHKKREIRVFVSSTFRDFTMEREAIIKKAFRDINRLCVDRGVFFTYVDLRWGITTEQTNDGKTIAICLQEIDRCRPYFICLMGDRFGWSQREDKKDETLNMTYDYAIENNPNLKWIDDYRYNTSVTQLEIFHGVLNDPDDVKDKCFFYLRNLPSQDEVSPELYKRLVSESEWHKQQQEYLKSLVQQHPKISVKKFKQADEVSELIKQDLKGCVDQEFPIGSELTKLEQQEINKHRSQNISQPFIILGESGCGKSALVANWAKQIEDSEKDTFIFLHFIGSSADSAHYIKNDQKIPSSDTELVHEIGKWLRMAGSLTKCVIVFDAVNQLDDGSGVGESTEHDLLWIPSEIPPNVFLLISTLPGRAMNACTEAGFPSMRVSPLQESEKMQIITDYLEGIYGKTLTMEQKGMIINVKQTSNPLYLKSLLDEVRMFGSFRTLTNKITEYLSAESPQDLFAKILERLEEEFEKGQTPRKDLVRDATTALWCSNRGMSESELVELLNIPSAIWSPFYISLYENLVNRNGILNFFHDHLRQAVERKYIPTHEAKVKGYLCLADFHAAKETSDRTVEELPFLLTKAGQMDRLKETITDLDVFYRLSDNEDGIFELIKAWKTLGGFDLSEESYMSKVQKIPKEDIMQNSTYYCKLYRKFLFDHWNNGGSKKIFKTLIKQLELNYGESHGTVVYNVHDHTWKYRCKHPDVIKGLHELGTVYSKLGEYDKAVRVYIDAINRQNRVTTPTQKLQLCEGLLGLELHSLSFSFYSCVGLLGLSTVYIQKEDMLEAKKLMLRALELATFVLGKKHNFVAAIFTRLGQLSYKQGRVDEALAYCLHDLKVTRSEVGTNHPRTAIVLNEIGLIYDDKNDSMAPQLYEAALSIFLETYGKNFLGTGTIRYNLGALYFGTNHFAKSKYQFTESYRVYVLFLGEDHPETKAVKQALDAVSSMTSDE
ncbi:NPHP3 [Mytilus edulis]|uniref:NPHP3 n=1 Tax=Mytilus edulis TaxID=6550 RepID=A0A8S3VBF0_MYTED|nr:NPHP3 [Mytilus edulis]